MQPFRRNNAGKRNIGVRRLIVSRDLNIHARRWLVRLICQPGKPGL
jgi:hypothetical protein